MNRRNCESIFIVWLIEFEAAVVCSFHREVAEAFKLPWRKDVHLHREFGKLGEVSYLLMIILFINIFKFQSIQNYIIIDNNDFLTSQHQL